MVTQRWTEETVSLLGGKIVVLKGGSGEPLVVIHRDNGFPGRQPFLEELAKHFTVYVPALPGYPNGDPKAFTWMVNVRDLAISQQLLVSDMGLSQVTVVGLGYGGWLVAELATMCKHLFKRMVLVGAMGIQPEKGEIFDQFLSNTEDYARTMFYDRAKFEAIYTPLPDYDQLEKWETCREQTSRIGWKPYMYNRALPLLLKDVRIPTQVVWGREDKVVPLECAELYSKAIPGSKLTVIDQCGHAADLEKPQQVVKAILSLAGKA